MEHENKILSCIRSSIWNYLKLAANFEHVFLPTDNLQQLWVNLLHQVWGSAHPQNEDSCAIGRLRRLGYFLSAWEVVPLPASKAAESATLPLISFPRLSSPLKIKPVFQIISQANQQSLCTWGWEEKLAIKSSMRSSVGKKSCSLLFLNLCICPKSPQRAFSSWTNLISWCNSSN